MLRRQRYLLCALVVVAAMANGTAQEPVPGTDANGVGISEVTFGSILPVVTETGRLSLSVDGLGTLSSTGTIQVQKPAGATVRSAYLAAATTGFSGVRLVAGNVTLDGAGFPWIYETPSSISSWNYWADVTGIVKPKVDAAAAGRVDFTVGESSTSGIDGEVLAVIFEDPNQMSLNTVVLLFGAQAVGGDTFNITLAEPIDPTDPFLVLDMGLGISYGFQGGGQYSQVDVNGTRLTTSAGGQDDGDNGNGALLTAGGLDDSNANPADPLALPTTPRSDDELYNLVPFVAAGETVITVNTRNPSNDDNIFFASLLLTGQAIVDEGILLTPAEAVNTLGELHTLTATVQDDEGHPIADRDVRFQVTSGPNAGLEHVGATDAEGTVSFTYSSTTPGTDVIVASFVNSLGVTITSTEVTKEWVRPATAVCPIDAAIDIEKWVNGSDANTAPGPSIPVGATITWTFVVRNTGSVPLQGVMVGDRTDVICTAPTLAPGATFTCESHGVAVAGTQMNVAKVGSACVADTGKKHPIKDSDVAYYTGIVP